VTSAEYIVVMCVVVALFALYRMKTGILLFTFVLELS